MRALQTPAIYAVETTGPIDLYVDGTTGSDNNTGQSYSQAVRTLQAALDRVPTIIHPGHRVIIHVAPTANPYTMPSFPTFSLGDRLVIIGDGAGGAVGDGFTALLSGRSAAAGSGADVVVDSVGGLTVDAYRGKTIEILTGAAAGDRRTIRDNTATNITPCRSFTAAVAAGDTYRIVEPACSFDMANATLSQGRFIRWGSAVEAPDVNGLALPVLSPRIITVNFRFTTSVASQRVLLTVGPSMLLGCEFFEANGNANVGYGSLETAAGVEDVGLTLVTHAVPTGNLLFGAPSQTSWRGWGVAVLSTGTQPQLSLASGHFFGYMVGAGITTFGPQADVVLAGGDLSRSISGTANGVVNIDSGKCTIGFAAGVTPVPRVRQVGGTAQACFALARGHLVIAAGSIETSGGSAPNRFGVLVQMGSRCDVRSTVSFTTAEDNLAIRGGSTSSLAALAALGSAGDHISRTDGSVIQRSN